MNVDNAITAGMFTLVGGYLVHSYRESIAMRAEYRERCERLELDLSHVHKEIDTWKEKYFAMTEENGRLKNYIKALTIQLEDIKEKFIPKEQRRIYASE